MVDPNHNAVRNVSCSLACAAMLAALLLCSAAFHALPAVPQLPPPTVPPRIAMLSHLAGRTCQLDLQPRAQAPRAARPDFGGQEVPRPAGQGPQLPQGTPQCACDVPPQPEPQPAPLPMSVLRATWHVITTGEAKNTCQLTSELHPVNSQKECTTCSSEKKGGKRRASAPPWRRRRRSINLVLVRWLFVRRCTAVCHVCGRPGRRAMYAPRRERVFVRGTARGTSSGSKQPKGK
jgi:hypothetical protein